MKDALESEVLDRESHVADRDNLLGEHGVEVTTDHFFIRMSRLMSLAR